MTAQLLSEIEKLQRLLNYESTAAQQRSKYKQEKSVLPMIQTVSNNIKNIVFGNAPIVSLKLQTKAFKPTDSPLYKLHKEISLKSDQKLLQLKSLMTARSVIQVRNKSSFEPELIKIDELTDNNEMESPINDGKNHYHSIDKFIKTKTIIGTDDSADEEKNDRLKRPRSMMNKNSFLKQLDDIIQNKTSHLKGRSRKRSSKEVKDRFSGRIDRNSDNSFRNRSSNKGGVLLKNESRKRLTTNKSSKKTIEPPKISDIIPNLQDKKIVDSNDQHNKKLAAFLKGKDTKDIQDSDSVIINNDLGHFKDVLGYSVNIENNTINKKIDDNILKAQQINPLLSDIHENKEPRKISQVKINSTTSNNNLLSDAMMSYNDDQLLSGVVNHIPVHQAHNLFSNDDIIHPVVENAHNKLISEDEEDYLRSKVNLKSSDNNPLDTKASPLLRKKSYTVRRTIFNTNTFEDDNLNHLPITSHSDKAIRRPRSNSQPRQSKATHNRRTQQAEDINDYPAPISLMSNDSKIASVSHKKLKSPNNKGSSSKHEKQSFSHINDKLLNEQTITHKTDRLTAYKGVFSSDDLNQSFDNKKADRGNTKITASDYNEKKRDFFKRFTIGNNRELIPNPSNKSFADMELRHKKLKPLVSDPSVLDTKSNKRVSTNKNDKRLTMTAQSGLESDNNNGKKYYMIKSKNYDDQNNQQKVVLVSTTKGDTRDKTFEPSLDIKNY